MCVCVGGGVNHYGQPDRKESFFDDFSFIQGPNIFKKIKKD